LILALEDVPEAVVPVQRYGDMLLVLLEQRITLHEQHAEAVPDGEDDELAQRERELTKEVPTLLEAMNRASDEVNLFERRAGEAQGRYRALLEQWSRCYEDLRSQHGVAIDRVKPFFDAAQVLSAASHRVQGVVREFSAASSQHLQAKEELRQVEQRLEFGAHQVQLEPSQQDGLSRATVRVLKCQQERDGREQEYARALREYQEAQDALEARRAQIGDPIIKRTLPCFRQLQQHQLTLASEQNRINALTERAKLAKTQYGNVLRELDRINMAVHAARQGGDAKALPATSGDEASAPEEGAPEEVPERVPEAAAHARPEEVLQQDQCLKPPEAEVAPEAECTTACAQ